MDTNLWGIIHGTQIFAPGMIAAGRPALIINTGSKQGITTPPGDPAYNVAKAGVKAFTEALQHTLRTTEGCHVTAHLLIPGFVFTPLTANGRTEKPDAAWTPDQTVAFMLERPGSRRLLHSLPRQRRLRATRRAPHLWAAGDIVENRPPLSRWHPDFADAAKRFMDQPNLSQPGHDSPTHRLSFSNAPDASEAGETQTDIGTDQPPHVTPSAPKARRSSETSPRASRPTAPRPNRLTSAPRCSAPTTRPAPPRPRRHGRSPQRPTAQSNPAPSSPPLRHCEERSDAAIQGGTA